MVYPKSLQVTILSTLESARPRRKCHLYLTQAVVSFGLNVSRARLAIQKYLCSIQPSQLHSKAFHVPQSYANQSGKVNIIILTCIKSFNWLVNDIIETKMG
jgi:hypothetical protein